MKESKTSQQVQIQSVFVVGLKQQLPQQLSLKNNAIPVANKEAIAQVAAVSSRSEKVGEYISEAMEKVGKDGVITIEESRGMETELEVVEGMQFDRGYLSQYMVTDSEKW